MQNKGKITIRTWLKTAYGNNLDSKAELETRQKKNYVYVQFEDTGSGIPKEIQLKIFDAFYTTKREGEGSGMGLFIVKQIVDKHNGTINVESEPGKTVFTVGLPVGG